IDGDVELQLLQGTRDEVVVRQRNLGIETETEQTADLAPVDLAEQFVAVDAGVRDVVGIDAPDAGDAGAVLGVLDVAHAGALIALLAVFAATLAVGLPGDGAVAAALAANASRGQHDVDGPQYVLHAVAGVLDAAGVHQEAGPGGAPHLGSLANGPFADAGD